MIQKIDIKKFGVFDGYLWNTTLKDQSFRSVNIIYGRNYSGKTTLARIFKCIEDQRLHPSYSDCDFAISLSGGTIITPKNLSDIGTEKKIRVYNTDFVRENLAWLHNEDGTIKPFTVLGAVNVELQKKITDIVGKLGSVEEKKGLQFEIFEKNVLVGSVRRKYDSLNSALETKLSEKAKSIKTNTSIYNVPVYSSTHLKSDIPKAGENAILSTESIEEKKGLIKEDPKAVISRLTENKPNFSAYFLKTEELLKRQIKPNQPIIDLVNDSLLQEWVRQGIDKHKHKRDSCGFCGGALSEDLWNKLDAHFSKESESFREELKKQVQLLNGAKSSLDKFLKFEKNNFYAVFGPKYDSLVGRWNSLSTLYSANIESLSTSLQVREGDIFKEYKLENIEDHSDAILDVLKEFNLLIDENNLKTKTLSGDQEKIRLDLRLSEVARYLKDFDYAKQLKDIADALRDSQKEEKERTLLQSTINDLNEQKRQAEAQAKDESKGAELVNHHLGHFFGHGELKLVAEENEGILRFKIVRGKFDARNLSEGECSLISFCYFIAKMEDEMKEVNAGDNLIIYIDDPISSLDSNHIFFMFSLIESVITNEKKYGQLFISTHNLDFLKYLRKLTIPKFKPFPDSKPKPDINHFIIERKNKSNSQLNPCPRYLKEYITEFNYLFHEIYKCSVSDGSTIEHHYQYNFANNTRKFLEAYLFYKYPSHILSLDARINKFFGSDLVSINLINRVINEYSHLGEHVDRGLEPIDVEAINKVAKMVVDKIELSDPDQFTALLESIGITQPAELIA